MRLGETALSHSSAPSGLSRLYIMVRDFVGGRSPELAKARKPRTPWQWVKGSKALGEAKRVLGKSTPRSTEQG
ncbi:hypothetical protein [Actibacterium sp. MT2.3-13A]|uniref:hypothetical protein n=1 Tax=Actibacterium sp. MT2.3-13A TaxID=2828332 RepID=UPI0020136F1B|nr:hypothetical protein [Actibacterium sp. MT2.3-13A]